MLLSVVVVVRALAVEALVTIREALRDPDNVLADSGGDPCLWTWVTCSGGLIYGLYATRPTPLSSVRPCLNWFGLMVSLHLFLAENWETRTFLGDCRRQSGNCGV